MCFVSWGKSQAVETRPVCPSIFIITCSDLSKTDGKLMLPILILRVTMQRQVPGSKSQGKWSLQPFHFADCQHPLSSTPTMVSTFILDHCMMLALRSQPFTQSSRGNYSCLLVIVHQMPTIHSTVLNSMIWGLGPLSFATWLSCLLGKSINASVPHI